MMNNLSVPNMTHCERLHLLGNGCSDDDYDENCKDCPFAQAAKDALRFSAKDSQQ